MFKFVNWPQIVNWCKSVRRVGPICVLKQAERDLGLIYEIKVTGRHKLVGPLDLSK